MNELYQTIFVVSTLILVAPFCIWDILEEEERYKVLKWLYIRLPSKLSKILLPLYWKYFYLESTVMFWGRCFPNERHNWYRTSFGLHCADCHAFVLNYDLTGSTERFPKAVNLLDVLL